MNTSRTSRNIAAWAISGEKIAMNKREQQAQREQAFRLNDEMYRAAGLGLNDEMYRAAGFGPPTDLMLYYTTLRACQVRLDAANAAMDACIGCPLKELDALVELNLARRALERAQK